MPLRDFECGICEAVQERFYEVVAGVPSCPECEYCGSHHMVMRTLSAGHVRGKTAIFPYTTTHITGDGTPVTVGSLSQLRRLERQYGVNVSGFSQDPGNPDSPRDLPVGRPGGREYEPQESSLNRGRRYK